MLLTSSPLRRRRWQRLTDETLAFARQFERAADDDLSRRFRELRWLAMSGEPLARLLPETYALIRIAAVRECGKAHFPVQILAGIALFDGGIAEMQTGEGKTLTALLPAGLHALAGKGCHVVTANDYLAARDAEFAAAIFARLGLTVGCIQSSQKPVARQPQYACDITYGTAKEMGFDFLRDRLKRDASGQFDDRPQLRPAAPGDEEPLVQRGLHFALVDEADSILIDDARTPLLIARSEENLAARLSLYRWCARNAGLFLPELDLSFDPRRRQASLTEAGCRKSMRLPKPHAMQGVHVEEIYRAMEQSLTALFAFQRDRDYVVLDGKIAIVDESTGRVMEGRKWQDGLHQAVEAKERVEITAATQTTARITVQAFFGLYPHLAGLTGTAAQAARELRRIYRLRVSVIPTHRPCLRRAEPARIFRTCGAKWQAVAEESQRLAAASRAVLIGTSSVEASEALSRLLTARNVAHRVLNCRQNKAEAEIVAQAGQPGRVTIATNMAGRGTDILLHEAVRRSGGLHVMVTEKHSSARIDRQLIGRTARQGDPGTYQFFLSLEDELFRCLSAERLQRLQSQAAASRADELPAGWISIFQRTQRLLERQHRKQRIKLVRHEQERNRTYRNMGLDPYLDMTDQ